MNKLASLIVTILLSFTAYSQTCPPGQEMYVGNEDVKVNDVTDQLNFSIIVDEKDPHELKALTEKIRNRVNEETGETSQCSVANHSKMFLFEETVISGTFEPAVYALDTVREVLQVMKEEDPRISEISLYYDEVVVGTKTVSTPIYKTCR